MRVLELAREIGSGNRVVTVAAALPDDALLVSIHACGPLTEQFLDRALDGG